MRSSPATTAGDGSAEVDKPAREVGWVDEPAMAQQEDSPPPRRRPLSWRVGLLALLTLVALLVSAVLGYRVHTARAVEAARAQALRAAVDAAEVVLSYDHRRLDRDVARARRLITGSFEREYTRFVRTAVRPAAERTGAVVKTDVRAASVASASSQRVVLVLFVNQTTTLAKRPEPRVDLTRVRMTMERVGERWLVSQVEAL
jgi:Mce-associated membrane protein